MSLNKILLLQLCPYNEKIKNKPVKNKHKISKLLLATRAIGKHFWGQRIIKQKQHMHLWNQSPFVVSNNWKVRIYLFDAPCLQPLCLSSPPVILTKTTPLSFIRKAGSGLRSPALHSLSLSLSAKGHALWARRFGPPGKANLQRSIFSLSWKCLPSSDVINVLKLTLVQGVNIFLQMPR